MVFSPRSARERRVRVGLLSLSPQFKNLESVGGQMRVYRLDIRRFRGFEAASIVPTGHVVLVGEPGAGRSDVIEGLERVLAPDSTRGRLPVELDFFRGDTDQRAEVEAVLGALGDTLEQLFFDHLEVWDREAGQLIEDLADPTEIDRVRYDLVVRTCYRASWDPKEEQGQHWVDYARAADPDTNYFERLGRDEREALAFASIDARSRPLDLGTRGQFRRLVERAAGGDFSQALDTLEQQLEALAGGFSGTAQMAAALDDVLAPLRSSLGLGNAAPADVIRFLPEGGSLSGLLRSLAPALDLKDGVDWLPLHRHGSTLVAMLSVAQALARAGTGGIVAVDDFGEGLDASMTLHLAASLRRSASQVWLSTRRSHAAEIFPPAELIRLTRGKAGSRAVHYGRTPKTKGELLAARHWHLQLLPAMASHAILGVEGPYDRAGLVALANRLHEEEGLPLPSASRVTIIDAGAADASGGSSALPRLMLAAKQLGLRTVAILDHDGNDASVQAVLDENLKSADAIVRLAKGHAIERALLEGLSDDTVRESLRQLNAAFSVPLPANLDALTGKDLRTAARKVIKHSPGFHGQFIDSLPAGTHPPIARALLAKALETAVSDIKGLVQL